MPEALLMAQSSEGLPGIQTYLLGARGALTLKSTLGLAKKVAPTAGVT